MSSRYTPIPSTEPLQSRRQRSLPSFLHLPRLRSSCICLTTATLILPASLLFLALLTYLAPGAEHMRPCLPFSLSRLSHSAHQRLSCEGISVYNGTRGYSNITPKPGNTSNDKTMSGISGDVGDAQQEGRLAGFLQSQKELFLQDLRDGKGRGWTVSMGNEAGGESGFVSAFEFWGLGRRSARSDPGLTCQISTV